MCYEKSGLAVIVLLFELAKQWFVLRNTRGAGADTFVVSKKKVQT